MHELTMSITVPYSTEEVWYWIEDHNRIATLNPEVERIELNTPPPIQEGSEITMYFTNVPTAKCIITVYEPNRELKNHTPLRIFGLPMGDHYHSFVLTPVEGGTQVEQFFRFEPTFFGRFIAGMIERGWPTSGNHYNDGLKRSLETREKESA